MTTAVDTRAPVVEISVGGTPLAPDLHAEVIEVRVEQAMSLADRLNLLIADNDLKLVDGETFGVGKEVTVRLGSPHSKARASEVFTGEVVAIEADIGPTGARLSVVALDKSHRLRRKTRTKAWTNVTVSDIAQSIAGQNGLRAGRIEAGGPPREEVLQHDESDWELLERLCDECGCDLDVDAGKLQLLERKADGSPVELTMGETLRSFRPRLSGLAQVDSVEVRSWRVEDKAVISETAMLKPSVSAQEMARSSAASALGGGELIVVDRPAESSMHAKTMAAAAASKLGASVIEGTGVAVGDPTLRAGGVVKLTGIGRRFGGEHRVVSATHVLRGGRGYETRFTVGAGGRPLVEEIAGRARSGGGGFAAHLAIGLVTQNEDPTKQGRVKLKYPALDDMTETAWVRIAWPAAGKGRGVVALPAIGDEVVVGFEHGDIERPLVLGALFNGKDTPGSALPPPGEQTVAMTLPGNVVTTIDGEHKTTAKMGITASSEDAISVSATGELKLSSDAPLQISSQATAKLSAPVTQIQGEGEASLQADGAVSIKSDGVVTITGAAIELSAEGALTLSGATVMIG